MAAQRGDEHARPSARSRTTKDVDLATLHATDLAEAERALSELVAVDLGDHLTFA